MGTVLQRGAAEYPNLQAVSMHRKWFAALQRAQTKINVEANKHPSITVGLCVMMSYTQSLVGSLTNWLYFSPWQSSEFSAWSSLFFLGHSPKI